MIMRKITVYTKERGLRTLKSGITLKAYQEKYPDAIKARKISFKELEEMDGGCITVGCECYVEPDGYCEHGSPSYLLAMGLI
jgi:hypothetical protein